MTLTDLLVIYFASGSPFAVHELLSLGSLPNGAKLMRSAMVWLLWPFFVLDKLAGGSTPKRGRSADDLNDVNAPEDRTWSIVRDLLRCNPREFAAGGRETVERFAGLSLALGRIDAGAGEAELFRVSGHRDARVGDACLRRRNAARLERHHKQARDQFLRLAASTERRRLLGGLVQLAAAVGDLEAAEIIANRAAETVLSEAAGEIWIPKREYSEM
jgi:hypothetical protein